MDECKPLFAGLVTPWSGRLRVQAPRSFVFQNPDHQVIMPTVGCDVAFGLGHRHDLSGDEVNSMVDTALEAGAHTRQFSAQPEPFFVTEAIAPTSQHSVRHFCSWKLPPHPTKVARIRPETGLVQPTNSA